MPSSKQAQQGFRVVIDGGCAWIGFNEDIARVYADAVQRGNPQAIVTFNPGVRLLRHTPAEDYTAGELNEPFGVMPTSRWWTHAQVRRSVRPARSSRSPPKAAHKVSTPLRETRSPWSTIRRATRYTSEPVEVTNDVEHILANASSPLHLVWAVRTPRRHPDNGHRR